MLLDKVSVPEFAAAVSAIGDPLFHGNTSLFIEDIINKKSEHRIFAAVRDGKTAGFLILSKVLDEAEIIEIAVAGNQRRKGIASELMSEVFGWCRENGVSRIFLEVRESNSPARAFYGKFGFSEDGCRKNYYRFPVEDAVLMSVEILSSESSDCQFSGDFLQKAKTAEN